MHIAKVQNTWPGHTLMIVSQFSFITYSEWNIECFTLLGQCNPSRTFARNYGQYVSPQMTLTADELFVHKICVTYDIETILGRFGPWEVPHAAK